MHFFVVLALVALAVSAQTNSGDKIASVAQSAVGKYLYCYGCGNDYGPTYGVKMEVEPYCDDRNLTGFDDSGLSKYAVYQGTGKSIVHSSQGQYDNCPNLIPVDKMEAGDLVFYGSSPKNIYHVAIYVGDNLMDEAPGHNFDCTTMPLMQTDLRSNNLIDNACRMW